MNDHFAISLYYRYFSLIQSHGILIFLVVVVVWYKRQAENNVVFFCCCCWRCLDEWHTHTHKEETGANQLARLVCNKNIFIHSFIGLELNSWFQFFHLKKKPTENMMILSNSNFLICMTWLVEICHWFCCCFSHSFEW